MSERKKQDGLTNFGVRKAHTTWETRLPIDHHSPGTYGLQFIVAFAEK